MRKGHRTVFMMSVLAAFLAACGGCVKSKVVVYVNPDGSGHLVVSRLFDQTTVDSVDAQDVGPQAEIITTEAEVRIVSDGPRSVTPAEDDEKKAGDAKASKKDKFFDEKALRREAKTYGAGVKFVKARRLDMDGGRGFIAVYSFKDINDVFIAPDVSRLQGLLYGGANGPSDPFASANDADDDNENRGGRRGTQGVEFNFQTGAVSRLKILIPPAEVPEEVSPDQEDGGDSAPSATDKDAAEWLSGGMSGYMWSHGRDLGRSYGYQYGAIALGLDVVFNGSVVTSGAAHTNVANRNRIVLLDLDTTRRDRKADPFSSFSDLYSYRDVGHMLKEIAKEPGSVMETNREVVVEFR